MNVPVKLIYGKDDWAKDSDRLSTKNLLKLSKYEIIHASIHFSFLENTDEVEKIIKS